jgi:hypothetical protein
MRVAVVPWVVVAAAPLDVVLDGVMIKGHLLTLVVNFKGAGSHIFLLPPEAAFLPVEDFKEDSMLAQPGLHLCSPWWLPGWPFSGPAKPVPISGPSRCS